MEIPATSPPGVNQIKLIQYKRASVLAQITIFYNLIERMVSVFFGVADETLSLFGFGIDSFVEVLSGIGIWNMVRRMRHNLEADLGPFEKKLFKSQAPRRNLEYLHLSPTGSSHSNRGIRSHLGGDYNHRDLK